MTTRRTGLLRPLLLAGVAMALLAAALLDPDRLPSSGATRAGWLSDFDALTAALAAGYANLDDRGRSRHLDVPALERETRDQLAHACARHRALALVRRFLDAFDDGHLRIDAPPSPSPWSWLAHRRSKNEDAPLPSSLPGPEACARLSHIHHKADNIWRALPGISILGDESAERPFFTALVPNPAGASTSSQLAVLRIPLFSFDAYPALCAAEWDARRSPNPTCDDECQDDFGRSLENVLTDRLAAQLDALNAAGATALLLDLTGNGGGSSVADPWMRQLTPVHLQGARQGMVRHPHWAQRIERQSRAFEKDLARSDLTPALRSLLTTQKARADVFAADLARRCDAGDPTPCPRILTGLFATGYLAYSAPGELAALDSKGYLFQPSQYHYREGVFRGPLFVLVDGRTSSASEYVTAALRDNQAARVLGEHTDSTGCGYTNGGIKLALPWLHANVKMPDCIRYRANGDSEAEGITPDVLLPGGVDDSSVTRAQRVLHALAR